MDTIVAIWLAASAWMLFAQLIRYSCKECGKIRSWVKPILFALIWPFCLTIPWWGWLFLIINAFPIPQDKCKQCSTPQDEFRRLVDKGRADDETKKRLDKLMSDLKKHPPSEL